MLLLVRHGRTGPNASRRLLGRMDVPLDELGRRQAEAPWAGSERAAPRQPGGEQPARPGPADRGRARAAGHRRRAVDRDRLRHLRRHGRSRPPRTCGGNGAATSAFVPEGGESLASVGARVRAACEDLWAEAAARRRRRRHPRVADQGGGGLGARRRRRDQLAHVRRRGLGDLHRAGRRSGRPGGPHRHPSARAAVQRDPAPPVGVAARRPIVGSMVNSGHRHPAAPAPGHRDPGPEVEGPGRPAGRGRGARRQLGAARLHRAGARAPSWSTSTATR